MSSRTHPGRGHVVALVMLGLAVLAGKLWLIAIDEVHATFAPHDQLRYGEMARALLDGRWFGDYDQFTLLRRPAYPLWMALVAITGLPLRIAAEILLAVAAAGLAVALARRGLRPSLAFLAYLAFVFEPHSFAINGELMSESFYGPLLALLVASLIEASGAGPCRRGAWWAAAAGVPASALWHARPEGVLVVEALVVAAFLPWPRPRTWPLARTRLAFLVVPPLLVLGLASAGISAANRVRYGLFTTCDMDAPGFRAVQDALLRIDVGPRRRYVAFPESARRAAYAASPTFARFAPYLEGPARENWLGHGCSYTGLCDDYGNGWFLFALRDAARDAGAYASAPETEAFYRRVAGELNAACEQRLLRCRPRWPRLLAVDPAGTARAMPRSFIRTAALAAAPPDLATPRDEPGLSPSVQDVFDRVANRRAWLTRPRPLEASGWAFGPLGAPTVVEWRAGDDRLLARTEVSGERPDVVRYFTSRNLGPVPGLTGFALSAVSPAAYAHRGSYLLFRFTDGSEHRVPARRSGCTAAECAVRYAVDRLEEPAEPAGPGGRFTIKTLLGRAYRVAVVLSAPVAAGLLVWLVATRRRATPALGSALLLLAFVVFSRVLLFAYVDAAWFPSEVRYMYPVVPLYAALVLGLVQAAASRPRSVDDHRHPEV